MEDIIKTEEEAKEVEKEIEEEETGGSD